MGAAIDTARVTGRRSIHFSTVDDILSDVEKIAACPDPRTLGNWSIGQIFQHLAVSFQSSIDGFGFTIPWHFRAMAKLFMKRRLLNRSMGAGFNLPKDAAAKLLPPPTSSEVGLQNIRKAIHRLKTEQQRVPSPFLGNLTNEEWTQLHCRHSELHLSFIVLEG
jgi:hypothetical protein